MEQRAECPQYDLLSSYGACGASIGHKEITNDFILERALIKKVAIYVSGQDFLSSLGRTNQQVMVDYGMGNFVS